MNDSARLISPSISSSGKLCVVFWYHMYGAHINALNLYVKNGGALGQPVWTKSGTQGNKWIQGQVDVNIVSGNQVCLYPLQQRKGVYWNQPICPSIHLLNELRFL